MTGFILLAYFLVCVALGLFLPFLPALILALVLALPTVALMNAVRGRR